MTLQDKSASDVLWPYDVCADYLTDAALPGMMQRLTQRLAGSPLRSLVRDCEHLAEAELCSEPWTSARFVEAVWLVGESASSPVSAEMWDSELRPRAVRARWNVLRRLDKSALNAALPGTDRLTAARNEWLTMLDRVEAEPWLMPLTSQDFDEELDRVARKAPDCGSNLNHHARVVDVLVSKHFLPRFHICGAARAVTWVRPHARWLWIGWASLVLAAIAMVCVTGNITIPAGLALAGYSVLIVAGLRHGAFVLHPVCLRGAAGAVIGAFALFSIDGWEADAASFDWFLHISVFLVPALYLLVEARQRDDRFQVSIGRAAMVFTLTVLHAAGVILVAIFVAGAAFLELGDADLVTGGLFDRSWVSGAEERLPLFAFATGAGVTAGVFLQLLWEDRSITAPLASFSREGR